MALGQLDQNLTAFDLYGICSIFSGSIFSIFMQKLELLKSEKKKNRFFIETRFQKCQNSISGSNFKSIQYQNLP